MRWAARSSTDFHVLLDLRPAPICPDLFDSSHYSFLVKGSPNWGWAIGTVWKELSEREGEVEFRWHQSLASSYVGGRPPA